MFKCLMCKQAAKVKLGYSFNCNTVYIVIAYTLVYILLDIMPVM